ncbi:hypothetical protein [Tissierella praeacuta]|uniref:hypothetical protein n=1 Tax=Tissierella praeacuta TaxID=43131 RepID=UPI0033422E7B
MFRTIKDAGQDVTIEVCQMYCQIGINCIWNDGKDLTLVDKKEELSSGNLKSSAN